ncbi:MAG: sulfur carrier protein ThiS [Synergistaceae bacterium]|jgi:thiamine biosynthesis protein ThiS|nr:sulfur carrier protein ThiS [Synergistaceae bacterium]
MITVNDNPTEWKEGMTVQDVLDLQEEKVFNALVTVWVNGDPISRHRDYLARPVEDGSVIEIISMITGG